MVGGIRSEKIKDYHLILNIIVRIDINIMPLETQITLKIL